MYEGSVSTATDVSSYSAAGYEIPDWKVRSTTGNLHTSTRHQSICNCGNMSTVLYLLMNLSFIEIYVISKMSQRKNVIKLWYNIK